ncbi:MAG: RNA-binding S4 domain-containing protein [Betaproteobacteria bacterium]|nr:RNA-binding S4 domain-containing protein [Betaproteobacteria bacterium]
MSRRNTPVEDQDDDDRCRIDKWLWAARFFKTRSLTAHAIDAGKVRWHEERIKPAKELKIGDRLIVTIGDYEWDIEVKVLETRRGSATIAQTLYQETPESVEKRALRVLQRKLAHEPAHAIQGRPTKRDRRDLERWKRG